MELLKILRLMGLVCVLGGNGEKAVEKAGKYGVEVGLEAEKEVLLVFFSFKNWCRSLLWLPLPFFFFYMKFILIYRR
jgi:predicted hydrocarbon binding protein